MSVTKSPKELEKEGWINTGKNSCQNRNQEDHADGKKADKAGDGEAFSGEMIERG